MNHGHGDHRQAGHVSDTHPASGMTGSSSALGKDAVGGDQRDEVIVAWKEEIRDAVRGRSRRITNVTLEDQSPTRFGGLAVLQDWFCKTRFRDRLCTTLRGIPDATSYGYPLLFVTLVIHYLLGYRRLQAAADSADDWKRRNPLDSVGRYRR